MFKNVYVPYKGYWSSPFCRWQGALQNQHAVELAAATAKRFFELRGITPGIFDGIVFGATVPQKMWFFHADRQSEYRRPPSRPGVRHRHGFYQCCRILHRGGKQRQCTGGYL